MINYIKKLLSLHAPTAKRLIEQKYGSMDNTVKINAAYNELFNLLKKLQMEVVSDCSSEVKNEVRCISISDIPTSIPTAHRQKVLDFVKEKITKSSGKLNSKKDEVLANISKPKSAAVSNNVLENIPDPTIPPQETVRKKQ